MHFSVRTRSHLTATDAGISSGGEDLAPSPKELVLQGIAGCTGIDVVLVLGKMRLGFESLEIKAEAGLTETYPSVFSRVDLEFHLKSTSVPPEKLLEAIRLSQTKYCGVSAMIAKACDIHYKAYLNGVEVGQGKADFSND